MKEFKLGEYLLSETKPPIFLAEIGGFFGQDIKLAKEMIGKVISISRKVPHQPVVLKTEILHDPEICLPGELQETYCSKAGIVKKENYRALIDRKCLPLSEYALLFAFCRQQSMDFLVSVYDFVGADFAVEQGSVALKIASANIVHIPLIRHCAAKGLPLVIDTGRASLAEVERAYDTAQEAGCKHIILEHSPDGHPALPEAHNLKILETYRQIFSCPVGLSDHHTGIEMLIMALALGAQIIEKGVHVDAQALDIDISHTMEMNDLETVLSTLYNCWQAMGLTRRPPNMEIKGVIGTSQRQGLVARKDLKAGSEINLENIRFAFPCLGVPVQDWDKIRNRHLVRDIKAGEPIIWQDV